MTTRWCHALSAGAAATNDRGAALLARLLSVTEMQEMLPQSLYANVRLRNRSIPDAIVLFTALPTGTGQILAVAAPGLRCSQMSSMTSASRYPRRPPLAGLPSFKILIALRLQERNRPRRFGRPTRRRGRDGGTRTRYRWNTRTKFNPIRTEQFRRVRRAARPVSCGRRQRRRRRGTSG